MVLFMFALCGLLFASIFFQQLAGYAHEANQLKLATIIIDIITVVFLVIMIFVRMEYNVGTEISCRCDGVRGVEIWAVPGGRICCHPGSKRKYVHTVPGI
jgi:hypothetical protein